MCVSTDVRVLSEDFRGLDQWDSRFQRLKVILILPQCSSSALHDPVETLLSEHGGEERKEGRKEGGREGGRTERK